MEDDRAALITRLADLLHQTAEDHHVAYAATDGVDPDWSIWYADHLLREGINEILDATILKSELIYLLVGLERETALVAPGAHWERFYADSLVSRYRK